MIQFITVVSSLALTGFFFYLSGLGGLVVAITVIVIFELMHIAVYGKSISHITDEDFHDHPDNPANVLRRLSNPERPTKRTERQPLGRLLNERMDEYR